MINPIPWHCQDCDMCCDNLGLCQLSEETSKMNSDDIDFVIMCRYTDFQKDKLTPIEKLQMDAWWSEGAELPVDAIEKRAGGWLP